ncbi:MAG: hypothetical protein IPN96_17830 [Anaerolineales bacterium]|nr:hypothetical protein [Anaerolineales bacterium]
MTGEINMENQPQQIAPILKVAWAKFAQLDAASSKALKVILQTKTMDRAFGVLATLFAILTELYPENFSAVGKFILKLLLIATPLLASGFAAFVSKAFSTGDWLITRAGRRSIKRDL